MHGSVVVLPRVTAAGAQGSVCGGEGSAYFTDSWQVMSITSRAARSLQDCCADGSS